MSADIGKLILRLVLGALVLAHGVYKVPHGITWIQGLLTAHHLPVFLAWGVYIGEIAAPFMILVGFHTRIGAMLIMINMLFAFFLAHMDQLLHLTPQGGWALELQAMYLFSALAVALLGPGKYKLHS